MRETLSHFVRSYFHLFPFYLSSGCEGYDEVPEKLYKQNEKKHGKASLFSYRLSKGPRFH